MSENVPMSRFDLPGHNLPLNFVPNDKKYAYGEMFTTALHVNQAEDGSASQRLTPIRELEMLRIMNHITDKPDWSLKVFDEAISNKWKEEAMSAPGRDVTQAMADWIIDELRWKTKAFAKEGLLVVYEGDVVKSDSIVPESIKDNLKSAVRELEDVPEKEKDYHPNSDNLVLDLVHPSLFPLVYGRSRILPDSLVPLRDCKTYTGKGETLEIPKEEETIQRRQFSRGTPLSRLDIKAYSRTFQWLPADLELRNDSIDEENPWKFTSYINNLDPERHENLYSLIEKVINKTIPLWNKTLDNQKDQFYGYLKPFHRITYDRVEYDADPEEFPEDQQPQQSDDESEDGFIERWEQWVSDNRNLILPEPGTFSPPEGPPEKYEALDLNKEYGHRGLQIIVKLANIHLTPEKPAYSGGTWHVEGQMNEHICATALYYYDVENITKSYLTFRHIADSQAEEDINYPQNDEDWLNIVFGCQNFRGRLQQVGGVLCKEGRLLTFPNVLQHRVEPFKLADPTKPGHRKILALFLVDPHLRIISSANIPPQRRDWWYETFVHGPDNRIAQLPAELRMNVQDSMDDESFPISMNAAKELRLELMEERKIFVARKEEQFQDNEFSLCEH